MPEQRLAKARASLPADYQFPTPTSSFIAQIGSVGATWRDRAVLSAMRCGGLSYEDADAMIERTIARVSID